jgi:hypothetical protein
MTLTPIAQFFRAWTDYVHSFNQRMLNQIRYQIKSKLNLDTKGKILISHHIAFVSDMTQKKGKSTVYAILSL